MDEVEARAVLTQRVQELRAQSYPALRDTWLRRPDCEQVVGPGGAEYQVEIEAVWDRGESGDLRVLVSVDDGGVRALAPLTDSFIVAPDGSFVGE